MSLLLSWDLFIFPLWWIWFLVCINSLWCFFWLHPCTRLLTSKNYSTKPWHFPFPHPSMQILPPKHETTVKLWCYCNGTEWYGKLVILAIQSIENTSHDILFLFLFLGKQFEKLISFHQKVDDLRLRGGKSNDEVT